MKYYIGLFLAILSFDTNANAIQSKIEIMERFDDFRVVAFVDRKDVNSSPEWDPNVGVPPLTLAEAIQAVKGFIGGSEPLNAVKEIEVRPVPNHSGHWHYLIKISDNEMKTRYDIYVVLMSGKVVPAIIEPQSYK